MHRSPRRFHKYLTVALMGWQDSLVYRFNALVWVLYAVVPAVTMMFVWLAAYASPHGAATGAPSGPRLIAGYSGGQMLTYYFFVTALSVAITPNPEWDIASAIRDGKITPFVLRPIGYFGYRVAWETSYQIVKSAMMLPAFCLLWWAFRTRIHLEPLSAGHWLDFAGTCLLAYAMLSQIKFLVGISAFWIVEPAGFMELGNVVSGLFAGRLLPLALLPAWAGTIGAFLPFSLLYALPMSVLQGRASEHDIAVGFVKQVAWLLVLAVAVRITWRRGLVAYEAIGG